MRNLKHRILLLALPLASLALPCFGASQLTFDSSAQPTGLVLGDVSCLAASPDNGFFLREGEKDNRLVIATTSGNTLIVSATGGSPRFTFRVDEYARHLSLHLTKVEGVGTNRNFQLRLSLQGKAEIGFKTLDDMISARSNSTTLTMRWDYLWAVPPEGWLSDGGHGSIVLYNGALEGAALDAALAEVWAKESSMPRPAGQASWTETDVLAWVSRYQAKYQDMTEIQMAAGSSEELYRLTDTVVIPNKIKRVYLHTATWRGEYWPNYYSRVQVNTNVFPAGKADLVAYANYLHAHGVQLRLHNVSFGIGKNDPDYIVGHVDRRLASWGKGTLELAVNATATTLLFRPAAGTVLPTERAELFQTGRRLYPGYLRLDEEIVKIGSINQTQEGAWQLDGCTRGLGGTEAAMHDTGTEMAGLYCSYDKNYIPEYDLGETNSLSDVLAKEYGDFVNDLQLDHLHFDGPEIHQIYPWTIRELLSRAYRYVDHPVTSSRVGRSIAANFEQAFSGVKTNLSLSYFALEVGVRLEKPGSYLATSLLDTHFHAQEGVLLHGRRVQLTVPQSGLGVNQNVLNAHGLSSQVITLFRDWQLIAPKLATADINYLAANMTKTPGSSHYQSEDVQVLQKNGANYVFVPHHVMGRTNGQDAPWSIKQEKGAVARKQAIKAGDTLELNNPKAAQALTFVIRNSDKALSLTNPRIEINGAGGSLQATGILAPGEYLQYEGGVTANVCDQNWKVVRTLPVTTSVFTVPAGPVSVRTTGTGTPALEVQFIVLGTPYVLATNGNLQ